MQLDLLEAYKNIILYKHLTFEFLNYFALSFEMLHSELLPQNSDTSALATLA